MAKEKESFWGYRELQEAIRTDTAGGVYLFWYRPLVKAAAGEDGGIPWLAIASLVASLALAIWTARYYKRRQSPPPLPV